MNKRKSKEREKLKNECEKWGCEKKKERKKERKKYVFFVFSIELKI